MGSPVVAGRVPITRPLSIGVVGYGAGSRMGLPCFTADRGVTSATDPKASEDPRPDEPVPVRAGAEAPVVGAAEIGPAVTTAPPLESAATVVSDITAECHPRRLTEDALEALEVSKADMFPIETI